MAGVEEIDVAPLSYCHSCQFDLRETVPEKPIVHDADASLLLLDACVNSITKERWNPMGFGKFAVMHQLCRIMTTRYKHALREFVLDQLECKTSN
jgi:hypothetical protein